MLIALATVLVPALAFGPHLLAANGSERGLADQRNLIGAVSAAFVEYWNSGRRELTPNLARLVDYWFRFHVVKAVIAAVLLVVLVRLGVLAWKACLRAGDSKAGRRVALASGGVLVTMLALLSLVIVIANVQGAVAPLTSLLTLLPVGAAHGELAATLDQVRQRLADHLSAGHLPTPALELMIGDNARYHLVVAVLATTLAVVCIGILVMLLQRYRRTEPSDRRARRVLASYAVFSALLELAMVVLALANATNTADPARGLLGFFSGGY
ncbi:hypothetical protein [Flindersiella endophytica]